MTYGCERGYIYACSSSIELKGCRCCQGHSTFVMYSVCFLSACHFWYFLNRK